ncbi:MAG: helix-hairpin-helix domain-containing protein [Anaerolineae bacterium]|nr:helix-hairpin-helix domain-containing protein [Anaerolineae bacterium]
MSDWLQRYRGYILITLVNLLVSGGMVLFLRRPSPPAIVITTPTATTIPAPTSTPTPAPLRVYVTGAVVHPDVYLLEAGSIVRDAVVAAGGATAEADLNRINLAQQVYDQQQIYIPKVGEESLPLPSPPASLTSAASSVQPAGKVNINTATAEELDTLPGIGPALAQRIIEYRQTNGPFQSIEEIKNVSGIGDKLFEKLKDLITI